MNPATQAAGTKAAGEARAREAEKRRALKHQLAHPDLSTPELIRAYLELVMVGVVTGDVPARAGAAAASVASRLLKAHELSISKKLDQLIKDKEATQRTQHQTGVTRHRR